MLRNARVFAQKIAQILRNPKVLRKKMESVNHAENRIKSGLSRKV